ncbi:MAG: diguanylate cyclase [Gammaproteobacteria bacterium]|nr:diguanylate cyclase [Gammaproteobacteria bacterium]
MTQDIFNQSAGYLKKAVPLMIKYQVPTTPTNYALWYAYVSEEIPQLNQELDALLDGNKICPPMRAELIYRHHVADKTDSQTWQLRQSVDAMLCELTQSVKDTRVDSGKFQRAIEKSFEDLHRVEDEGWSIEEVMVLIRNLAGDTKRISNAAKFFNHTLEKSQQEIESLKKQLAATEKLALYDSLTGLLNRHSFDAELTSLMAKNNQGLCLILADIDHFKRFNDQYGHLLGDQVLKSFGRRLNDSARDGSQAYRFGGEEFAILLPQSGLGRARQFAETTRKLIEKLSVRDKRTAKSVDNISASFGVSEFRTGDTLTSFITRADEQLYEAKRLGRNRVLPITS